MFANCVSLDRPFCIGQDEIPHCRLRIAHEILEKEKAVFRSGSDSVDSTNDESDIVVEISSSKEANARRAESGIDDEGDMDDEGEMDDEGDADDKNSSASSDIILPGAFILGKHDET
jgi:hypothetical protein